MGRSSSALTILRLSSALWSVTDHDALPLGMGLLATHPLHTNPYRSWQGSTEGSRDEMRAAEATAQSALKHTPPAGRNREEEEGKWTAGEEEVFSMD